MVNTPVSLVKGCRTIPRCRLIRVVRAGQVFNLEFIPGHPEYCLSGHGHYVLVMQVVCRGTNYAVRLVGRFGNSFVLWSGIRFWVRVYSRGLAAMFTENTFRLTLQPC
jgi:hypothetical protein